MLILFLKSTDTPRGNSEPDPLPGKLRLILQSRVKEAKTKEDRERAEEELRKFDAGCNAPDQES